MYITTCDYMCSRNIQINDIKYNVQLDIWDRDILFFEFKNVTSGSVYELSSMMKPWMCGYK